MSDRILIDKAQAGDRKALEALVQGQQDAIHRLAMRFLVNPEDALEATQEILVLVVTKLSTFRGESAFRTWVYRIAVNYLLTAKKVLARDPGLSFEAFREDLHAGLVPDPDPSAEDKVALNELRISCTMAMLLCLDLKHRMAYVLGDILELDHGEAAAILEVSKPAYRQRLSRARKAVVDFTARDCGLANSKARCSCPKRLPAAIDLGRVRPGVTPLSDQAAEDYAALRDRAKGLESALCTLTLQRAVPQLDSPRDLSAELIGLIGD